MALCALSELEQYRVLPGLNIWVVPGFARHVLGCGAALLQTELERAMGSLAREMLSHLLQLSGSTEPTRR